METAPVHLPAYWRLLRSNRNYRLLWTAQLISEIGDWLYMVSIYSLLLELTGSAKIVAFAFVLQVLPQTFVSPAAGVINDRLSRRKVMIFTDWCRALIVFSMVFVRTREMLWFLYLLLVMETILWALFEPARTSVIPNITKGPETLVANALSSTTWSFTLAVGSAVGGVLAVVFGRDTVFVLDALSFIGSALLLRRMYFIEPHIEDLPPLRAKDLADFSPISDGVKYVAKDPRRMATMFVKCGLGLMGTNWVLLPIFGTRIYPMAIHGLDPNSAGMLGMSVLMGCRGIGALLGPFIASTWTGLDERNFRRGILCGFALGFLGYCTLGLSQNLAMACLGIVIAHSGGAIAWVFSTTLLQMKTDDKFRGRVFSAEFALSMLTLSIVSYSAGLLADDGVSVRTLAICTGFLVLIPGILWAFAQRLWREPVSA
jgi:MFS family permease